MFKVVVVKGLDEKLACCSLIGSRGYCVVFPVNVSKVEVPSYDNGIIYMGFGPLVYKGGFKFSLLCDSMS